MKSVLYMHFGSGNHGCEAIIRTTAELLHGPQNLLLWSYNPLEDYKYGTAEYAERVYASEEIGRFSLSHAEAFFRRRLLQDKDAYLDVFLRNLFKNNAAVSVGGDNYCYPWSAEYLANINKKIRQYSKCSVLWGCSVDQEMVTPEVQEDLKKYDLITAREEITYNYLKTLNPNTVKVADPAFLMKRQDCPLPKYFQEKNTVGINLSPMVLKYGSSDSIIENYRCLIDYILKETDMNICLISHVVWKNSDDREPIDFLLKEYLGSDRICKVDDGTAEEIKGYIARCRFFVGARTHATIAAYSSFVPTLVVGYSIKSKGIAKDLFGTDDGYVIPVQNLDYKDSLMKGFKWLLETEDSQRKHLMHVMPDYLQEARNGKDAYERLIRQF